MPGFDVKRFVGLEDWLAKELECCLCLNILNKAVFIECGHSYCNDCTHPWRGGSRAAALMCINCEHRSVVAVNRHNDHQLKPNIAVNRIVGKLKIKCDFADKGCEVVVETALLAAHLVDCPYTMCSDCGLSLADNKPHDCVQELKEALNQSEKKCQDLMDKMADMVPKCESTTSDDETLPAPSVPLKRRPYLPF